MNKAAILPAGCGQHLFAAGHRLPQLKQLVLGVHAEISDWWDGFGGGWIAKLVSSMDHCLDEGSMSRVVSCCPALQQLWLAGLVEPGVDLRPLLQLTALSDLCIGGPVVTDTWHAMCWRS